MKLQCGQRQVFKNVEILSEQSKEIKEEKKVKGSVLVAESAYNAQNAQFGLEIFFGHELKIKKIFYLWSCFVKLRGLKIANSAKLG